MKCEIVGTTNVGDQELLCTVTLERGSISVSPAKGHEKWKTFIFDAGDVPDEQGQRIDPDRSPTKWFKRLPYLFDGHRVRARMVK